MEVPADAASVDVVLSLPDGAVILRAINREGQRASEIVAFPLDVDGRAAGPTRLLRRTTGPVVALDASAHGDALWVAWASARPVASEGPPRADFLVAALRATRDLSAVERPVTLEDFRGIVGDEGEVAPQAILGPRVDVVATEEGAVVLASAAPTTCVHDEGPDHRERVACRAWSTSRVGLEGRVSRAAEGLVAMTEGPYGLLGISGGYVYGVDDEHIGYKASARVGPTRVGTAPPFPGDTFWHYRAMRFAAANGAVFAVATPTEEGMAASPFGHIRALDGAHARLTRIRQDRFGSDEWPALRARALRCVSGRPAISLRWDGGAATLDPSQPGTRFRWDAWVDRAELPGLAPDGGGAHLALGYTGRVLVAWDGRALRRWRCGAGASLEPAP